jgi:hypothetical protein
VRSKLTIDEQWAALLKDAPADLRPLIERASREPVVRAVFPFTSHSDLRFAKRPEFRFGDLPYVATSPRYGHSVRDADGRPLFWGDAERVAVRLTEEMARALALGSIDSPIPEPTPTQTLRDLFVSVPESFPLPLLDALFETLRADGELQWASRGSERARVASGVQGIDAADQNLVAVLTAYLAAPSHVQHRAVLDAAARATAVRTKAMTRE